MCARYVSTYTPPHLRPKHVALVERSVAHNLSAALAQMRSWLDHHRIELKSYPQSGADGGVITVLLEFSRMDEAVAFVEALGGRILPGDIVGTPCAVSWRGQN